MGLKTNCSFSFIANFFPFRQWKVTPPELVAAKRCRYSYLFWSDGTGSRAKIERSDLSGKHRRELVTSTQGLVSPTTLVVDFSSDKLYWLDSAAERIGHVNFDGSQPLTRSVSGLSWSEVSAMTIYRVRRTFTTVDRPTFTNSVGTNFVVGGRRGEAWRAESGGWGSRGGDSQPLPTN